MLTAPRGPPPTVTVTVDSKSTLESMGIVSASHPVKYKRQCYLYHRLCRDLAK